MKLRFIVLIGLLVVIQFFAPMSNTALSDTKDPGVIIGPIIILPQSAIVYTDSSVYISESNPTSNFNSYDYNNLHVGVDEFTGRYESLIKFDNILQSNGGTLPDDAEITSVGMRIYKGNDTPGEINIYRLSTGFNENTVTWDTKPFMVMEYGRPKIIATASLPSPVGWYLVNLPVSMLESWISNTNSNNGILIAPNWSSYNSISFRSDEYSSSRPYLVIGYTGSASEPTPSPTPLPVDNTPCQVSYIVTPSNPNPGEQVTITVTATDNEALSHISIMRGFDELAREEASFYGDKLLQVSYTETAVLPGLNYTIIADDVGDAPGYRNDIFVPVTGSGTPPSVDISIEWLDVETVVPEKFRLIQGDNQAVRIAVEASDPDGIRMLTVSINGDVQDFTYEGETSVNEIFFWVNSDRSDTTFSCYAGAQDNERLYSAAETLRYDIVPMDDIRVMWSCAPGFANYGTDRLSWTRMVQVFGKDECWWVESWDWKDPKALTYYHARFKDIADGGSCYGFSTLSNELYSGRIVSSDIEFPKSAYQMDKNNSYTKEYIEARQAGQLGRESIMALIEQKPESDDFGIQNQVLAQIESNLERDDLGIIGIREGDSGHAIVPWMTRHMSDGTTMVFVYDSNKISGIHNAAGDLNDFNSFPYLEIFEGGWFYQFNSTDTWNDNLYYYTYDQIIGNPSKLNRLGTADDAPLITDQTIPTLLDATVAVLSGKADIYFEDNQGRVTGIKNGIIKEEIPGSMAIIPMNGEAFSDNEMYILPSDIKLTANVLGTGDNDEYILGLLNDKTVYSLEEKTIVKGSTDVLVVEPDSNTQGHKLNFMPGTSDNDFIIRLSSVLPGSVEKLGTDYIGREYILENCDAKAGNDISIYIKKGGSGLVAGSKKGGMTFDAIARSTESADSSDTIYIPQSIERGVVLGDGETLEITPENWATSEQEGKMIVSSDTANVGNEPTATPEPTPTETPSSTTELSESPSPSASPESSAEPTLATAPIEDDGDDAEIAGPDMPSDEEPLKNQFEKSWLYIGIAVLAVAGGGAFAGITIYKKKKK